MINEIELLSGKVVIDAPKPAGLEDDLVRFFDHPNNAKWGSAICRSLYHESLHFWQFLGYRFVAAWVADEWERLLNFETTGLIAAPSPLQKHFTDFQGDGGFSAKQLLECWTRSWEVHTRGASTIIMDEGLDQQVGFQASCDPIYDNLRPYTGEAFDYVMLHGPRAGLYERPYRWVLEAFDRDSYLAAMIFPLACHGAFRSPDPVTFFERIVSDAVSLMRRDSLFEAPTSRLINLDWAIHSKNLLGRLLPPVFFDAGVGPADGLSLIPKTSLAKHPIYPHYLERYSIYRGYINMNLDNFKGGLNGSKQQKHNALIAIFAHEDPSHVFLCPGEPMFRDILATAFPPVRVAFEDSNVDVGHVPMRKLQALTQQIQLDDYSLRIDNLDERVTRFRTAEVVDRLAN